MSKNRRKHPANNHQQFVDEIGRLLVPWGVPQTAARLYGYLVLSAEPISLDRIAEDLEISKSTASVAARLLEMYTLARRHGARGSRRVLYEASDNFEGILNEQKRLLLALADAFRGGARAASGKTRDRLEAMADFYVVTGDAMESALRQWGRRKRT